MHRWLEPRPLPPHFWDSAENRHQYLNWLGKKLGYRVPDDWYQIRIREIEQNRGRGLFAVFGYDRASIMRDYMPDHDWREWCFTQVAPGFWADRTNRSAYIKWLGKMLGYTEMRHWYGLTQQHFRQHYGMGFLSYYGLSHSKALRDLFPHFDWQEWLFADAPKKFWHIEDNRKRYLEWLGKQLGFKTAQDWYAVSEHTFDDNHGAGLVNFYSQKKIDWRQAIAELFSKHELLEWLLDNRSSTFWRKLENRTRYMRWLGKELNFVEPHHWYDLKSQHFRDTGGEQLLMHVYGGSVVRAIKEFMPDVEWCEWLFVPAPTNLFESQSNRIRYLRWLGKQLGFEKESDWYGLRKQHFEENRGGTLLTRYYQSSPWRAVLELFPHIEWLPWQFAQVPGGYWEDRQNRHRYMTWLAEKVGFSQPEDWYEFVAETHLGKHGGLGLLDYFGDRTSLLRDFLPDWDWQEWKFRRTEYNFWTVRENRRRYMEWLATELGYTKAEDWYEITRELYYFNYGGPLVTFFGNVVDPVLDAFPEHNLSRENFRKRRKWQLRLYRLVRKLYTPLTVIHEYKHPQLKFKVSGYRMELDVFVPDLRLAFEFQGEQHKSAKENFGGLAGFVKVQKRDQEKREACAEQGICLIEIHYDEWDLSEEFVISKIPKHLRPGHRTTIRK